MVPLTPEPVTSEMDVKPSPAERPFLARTILHGTALYSVALLVQRAAGFALLPVNTRFLMPADYGVLELLEQIGLVFSVIMGVNLSAGLGYFYFKATSDDERRVVTGTTIIGSAVVGAVATIIGLLAAYPVTAAIFGSPGYYRYLQVVFLTLPLSVMLESGFAWLRVTDQPKLYAIGSMIRAGVTVVGTLIFVALLHLRIAGVLTTSVLSILVTCAFVLFLYFSQHRLAFSAQVCWRMLRYAIPLGLSNIAFIFIHFGDRFFLPRYVSLADLGVYAVAYKISMLLSLVYSSFHTYWSAQVFTITAREDAPDLLRRIFTYTFTGVSLVAVMLIVTARPVLYVLTPASFHGAAILIPVIVAAYHIRTIGDFFRCLFLAANRPSWDAACTWTAAIVCLLAYVLLIPRFGAMGAAIATLVTFVCLSTISVVLALRLRPIDFEVRRLATVFLLSILLSVLGLKVHWPNLLLSFAWAIFLIASFPVLLLLTRFATADELMLGRRAIGKFRHRFGI